MTWLLSMLQLLRIVSRKLLVAAEALGDALETGPVGCGRWLAVIVARLISGCQLPGKTGADIVDFRVASHRCRHDRPTSTLPWSKSRGVKKLSQPRVVSSAAR